MLSGTHLETIIFIMLNIIIHNTHLVYLYTEPADPEYFYAYSGQTLQLHCGFSTTPGEILWFISNTILTTNDSFLITQHLLHSTPNVLYEGVLDIVDDSYRSHSLILQCIIHNTIIGNNLDSTPLSETIGSMYSVIYVHCKN